MDSLYFLEDQTGGIVLEKHFIKNSSLSHAAASKARTQILSSWWPLRETSGGIVTLPPLGSSSSSSSSASASTTILSLNHNGLFIVAVISQETAPLGVYYLVIYLVNLMSEYFGGLSEQIILQNFDVVYQLLEDSLDEGQPYITEPAILKQLVPPPSLFNTVLSAVSGQSTSSPLPGMISKCPWRPIGLKYAHNEIFFDIVEELDCIIDENGVLVCAQVIGQIECISRLSGMPEIVLALGNKSILDSGSTSLHPCINLARWLKDGTMTFIPPDGNFTLMEYTMDVTMQQIPVLVKPTLKKSGGGEGKLDIKVSPRLGNDKSFEYLSISVHLPGVSSVHSNTTMGTCEFSPIEKNLTWNIGAISMKSLESLPFASLTLSDSIGDHVNLEFVCSFRVNMHCLSGNRIDGLTVHNEAYQPFKGGRSYVKSGRVHFRIAA